MTKILKTEVSERYDGKYNVWGLTHDTESHNIINEDGSIFRYTKWIIVGVGDDLQSATKLQKQFFRRNT